MGVLGHRVAEPQWMAFLKIRRVMRQVEDRCKSNELGVWRLMVGVGVEGIGRLVEGLARAWPSWFFGH